VNILAILAEYPCSASRLHCELAVFQADLFTVELDKAVLSNAPAFFVQVPVDLDLAIRVYQRTLLVVLVYHGFAACVKSNRFVCLYYTIIGTISQASLAYFAKFLESFWK
jgi:hypothetical protein